MATPQDVYTHVRELVEVPREAVTPEFSRLIWRAMDLAYPLMARRLPEAVRTMRIDALFATVVGERSYEPLGLSSLTHVRELFTTDADGNEVVIPITERPTTLAEDPGLPERAWIAVRRLHLDPAPDAAYVIGAVAPAEELVPSLAHDTDLPVPADALAAATAGQVLLLRGHAERAQPMLALADRLFAQWQASHEANPVIDMRGDFQWRAPRPSGWERF